MTKNDARKALLDGMYDPKEIRTNDGQKYFVKSVEHWTMSGDILLVVPAGRGRFNYISVRNISAIGPAAAPRRRRA